MKFLIYFSQFDFLNSNNKNAEINYLNLITEIFNEREPKKTNSIKTKPKLPIIFIAGDEKYIQGQNIKVKDDFKRLTLQIKDILKIDIGLLRIPGSTNYNEQEKQFTYTGDKPDFEHNF